MLGDTIKLSRSGGEAKGHLGKVHRVEAIRVFLRLHASFNPGMLYDVEFCLSRSPFRRMHQALLLNHGLGRVLFPDQPRHDMPSNLVQLLALQANIVPFDPRVASNPPQLAAVRSILALPRNSPPFIVFGP